SLSLHDALPISEDLRQQRRLVRLAEPIASEPAVGRQQRVVFLAQGSIVRGGQWHSFDSDPGFRAAVLDGLYLLGVALVLLQVADAHSSPLKSRLRRRDIPGHVCAGQCLQPGVRWRRGLQNAQASGSHAIAGETRRSLHEGLAINAGAEGVPRALVGEDSGVREAKGVQTITGLAAN